MRPPPRDSHWDVIVVGSGLGGLSAAAALARRGFRVLVCEQHDVPGGYAHHFLRRVRGTDVVYAFDVALHQTGSLTPGRRIHAQLADVGVLERLRLRRFDIMCRTRGPAHDFLVPADPVAYRHVLGDLFPEHRKGVDELFARLGRIDLGATGYDDPPTEALACLGRTLKEFVRDHVPCDRFLTVFSPLWAYLGLPPAELCAFTFAQVWASYHFGGCFYLEGGGQSLSNAFVSVIEEARGQVILRTPVARIVTEGGRIVGVETKRYGRLSAGVVISNASAPDTVERLLDNPALAMRERAVTEKMPISVSIHETYLGIRGRADELGLPDRLCMDLPSYDLDEHWAAIQRGDLAASACILANHNLSDPGSVPAGRSVLNAAVLAEGRLWEDLDERQYRERKREVESHLVERIARVIPGLRDRIEVCETGTPRTMSRYSLNPRGAIYGIPASPKSHPMRRPQPRTSVPGLYLAGAWTFPVGGFEGSMTSGFHTARLVGADLHV